MEREQSTPRFPDTPPEGHRFNNYAYEPMIHQRFQHLRARLMNLAESSTRDRQQADAMKGLMKDFLNEAYYPLVRDIEDFCRDKGVIDANAGQIRPEFRLTAKSLTDILYDPQD